MGDFEHFWRIRQMPVLIVRGKTGVPQTTQEGNTIVVKKDIANAVLEERHPATRRNGKQAPTAVYTKAEVKAKVAAATKATATGMNTMASKHAVELENGFAKKTRFMKGKVAAAQKATVATKAAAKALVKKVQEMSAADKREAIVLNADLITKTEKQARDLIRIREQRDKYKERKERKPKTPKQNWEPLGHQQRRRWHLGHQQYRGYLGHQYRGHLGLQQYRGYLGQQQKGISRWRDNFFELEATSRWESEATRSIQRTVGAHRQASALQLLARRLHGATRLAEPTSHGLQRGPPIDETGKQAIGSCWLKGAHERFRRATPTIRAQSGREDIQHELRPPLGPNDVEDELRAGDGRCRAVHLVVAVLQDVGQHHLEVLRAGRDPISKLEEATDGSADFQRHGHGDGGSGFLGT